MSSYHGCKWSYTPRKWPYKWATGVITYNPIKLRYLYITRLVTGRSHFAQTLNNYVVGLKSYLSSNERDAGEDFDGKVMIPI